ncbi:MAG: hypothetical protein IJC47_03065, partial [Alistipes sp.]|nr:hypothetical protein [Alistipes sp.]
MAAPLFSWEDVPGNLARLWQMTMGEVCVIALFVLSSWGNNTCLNYDAYTDCFGSLIRGRYCGLS